jgi:ammonium transporter, Amt family
MIAIGAVAERGRLGPLLVFVFAWSTVVYDPIACWIWNSNGWSFKLGGLDFAGGSPVHISSGTAALVISIYLGKRRGYGTDRLAYKPNNTSYVVLGTALLWFGWFGFNGGSALSANLRAAQACVVTNLCASVAGLTWMLWVRNNIRAVFLFFIYGAFWRTGLASGEEVVSCRILLWRHRWTRRDHPRIRFRRLSYV